MDFDNCVFCDILAGRQRGSFVHRDDLVAAFLTIGPINPGHVLIVPTRHAAGVEDLTSAETEALFSLARRVAAALRKSAIPSEGFNYWLADGEAAFQDVFHVHLHVFPRFAGDSFKVSFEHRRPAREELDQIASEVAAQLERDLEQP